MISSKIQKLSSMNLKHFKNSPSLLKPYNKSLTNPHYYSLIRNFSYNPKSNLFFTRGCKLTNQLRTTPRRPRGKAKGPSKFKFHDYRTKDQYDQQFTIWAVALGILAVCAYYYAEENRKQIQHEYEKKLQKKLKEAGYDD